MLSLILNIKYAIFCHQKDFGNQILMKKKVDFQSFFHKCEMSKKLHKITFQNLSIISKKFSPTFYDQTGNLIQVL